MCHYFEDPSDDNLGRSLVTIGIKHFWLRVSETRVSAMGGLLRIGVIHST